LSVQVFLTTYYVYKKWKREIGFIISKVRELFYNNPLPVSSIYDNQNRKKFRGFKCNKIAVFIGVWGIGFRVSSEFWDIELWTLDKSALHIKKPGYPILDLRVGREHICFRYRREGKI